VKVPATSQKNQALLPSANDLSFGGQQLTEQLQSEVEEQRRKRLLLSDRANPVLSPATLSLFGGIAPRR
jgi:hypothetical protein